MSICEHGKHNAIGHIQKVITVCTLELSFLGRRIGNRCDMNLAFDLVQSGTGAERISKAGTQVDLP